LFVSSLQFCLEFHLFCHELVRGKTRSSC
jgi:hypothetical protein